MKLHVGQGTTVGALTVFPVWHDRTSVGPRRYDTGAENLLVEEAAGGPTVPQLLATNTGERPVLVLDGQLFEGGWQHRMAIRSSLLGVGVQTPIDVACVEQQRWGGAVGQTTRGRRATTYVRNGHEAANPQQEVWRRVQRYGTTQTASLAERLDVPDEQVRLVQKRVRPLAGQAGVLIGIGGQPLALEVFDHPQTLREQLPEILRAACLDAYGVPALPTPGWRARRMVERLEGTALDVEPRVGQTAQLGRARTDVLDVMSLRRPQRTVHLRAVHLRHPILQEAA